MDLPDIASRWLPTMSSFRGRTSLRRMCQDWPSSRMCRDFNSAWSVQQSPPPRLALANCRAWSAQAAAAAPEAQVRSLINIAP